MLRLAVARLKRRLRATLAAQQQCSFLRYQIYTGQPCGHAPRLRCAGYTRITSSLSVPPASSSVYILSTGWFNRIAPNLLRSQCSRRFLEINAKAWHTCFINCQPITVCLFFDRFSLCVWGYLGLRRSTSSGEKNKKDGHRLGTYS